MDNFAEALELGITAVKLAQSKWLHQGAIGRDLEYHDKEIQELKKQQTSVFNATKLLYLRKARTDMRQHFQQLNADILLNAKELERDMSDQKVLWCQTVILAATIMLTSLITVLIQGVLPGGDLSIYLAYSISNAGSLGCLFTSIIIHVEIVRKINVFSFNRSKRHTKYLTKAIHRNKKLLKVIRPSMKKNDLQDPRKVYLQRNLIFGITSEREVDKELAKEFDRTEEYLPFIDRINDKTEEVLEDTFQMYWDNECKSYDWFAKGLFSVGTYLMLVAHLVFMWVQFEYHYTCKLGSYIALVVLSTSILVSFIFHALFRRRETADMEQDVKDRRREQENEIMRRARAQVHAEIEEAQSPRETRNVDSDGAGVLPVGEEGVQFSDCGFESAEDAVMRLGAGIHHPIMLPRSSIASSISTVSSTVPAVVGSSAAVEAWLLPQDETSHHPLSLRLPYPALEIDQGGPGPGSGPVSALPIQHTHQWQRHIGDSTDHPARTIASTALPVPVGRWGVPISSSAPSFALGLPRRNRGAPLQRQNSI